MKRKPKFQSMKINPRLYQAMDLLYMPLLDLQQHIKQELQNNPFLELEARERSPEPMNETRIAVVGGGPCGLGVGVAARQASVDCKIFDKSSVVSAIANYPTHMTFFSTAEK